MSCSNDSHSSSSRNKNFTQLEKKIFLQILHHFKHVIESKKTNSITMREKEIAWKEISSKYNKSTVISQERTVQQLKKLWTNIKHTRKEVIRKKRLSHMVTSEEAKANIDPDVTHTTSYFIKTAPVLFTSNMTEKESDDKHDFVLELISTNDNIESLIDENDTSTIQDKVEQCNKELTDKDVDIMEFYPSSNEECTIKRKEITKSDAEENIRVERIKQIMQQEQQLANIISNHEKKMAAMKEEYLKEFNYLQLKHLKEKHEEELKIKKAELKSIEYQWQQKANFNPHI